MLENAALPSSRPATQRARAAETQPHSEPLFPGNETGYEAARLPGRLARLEPVQLPLKAPDRCEDVPQLAPEKHAASPPEPLLVGVERFQLPPRVSLRRCPLSSHEYGLVHADAVYPGRAYMSTVIWCGLLIM